MSTSRILKCITAILELLLAIPILGGSIVIAWGYSPLVVMFFLHLAAVIFAAKADASKAGNILGIITSCIAWIPFVGWALHLVTGIIVAIDAAKNRN